MFGLFGFREESHVPYLSYNLWLNIGSPVDSRDGDTIYFTYNNQKYYTELP